MEYGDQIGLEDTNEEYAAFVEKFKPRKTTDDCYTPPAVMEVINAWVAKEYGRDPAGFVRPFWPGANYKREEYPEGCTVVDNPPFSIISEICDWYTVRKIGFFLFAPGLTCMGLLNRREKDIAVIWAGGGYHVREWRERQHIVRDEP